MTQPFNLKTCNSILNCEQAKTILFKKDGYIIKQCDECGHRFAEILDAGTHVAQVYSDEYFFDGRAGYPNYLKERDLLIETGMRYGKILSKYRKPGMLLDVGCAAGFIMKGLQQAGWNCYGIEPNETMAHYGRDELKQDIVIGNLESYKSPSKYDVVTLIQVIGHFYDLDKALQNISASLKKDGMVLVESWNMNSIVARMLGRSWHEYSPPSVIHWFSDKTLTNLFKFYGFESVAMGLPVKRINLSHAISIVEEKSPEFAYKKKVVESIRRMIGGSTVFYPPMDLKWYLFGKSQH